MLLIVWGSVVRVAYAQEIVPQPMESTLPSGAMLAVYPFEGMTLHAYTADDGAGLANGTYIIEGESELVVIDTQYVDHLSADFRAYADSLDKPINRVIVTHEHLDHINGLESAFADVPSYASLEVIAVAESQQITITNSLTNGAETIDGITYQFEIVEGIEAGEQTIIKLPDYGVVALGDLFYNDVHPMMNRNLNAWIASLREIEETEAYELYLAGHGNAGDANDLANAITYLQTAVRAYLDSATFDQFRASLINQYPQYSGQTLFSFMEERLYPKVTLPVAPSAETFTIPDGWEQKYSGVEAVSIAVNDGFAWISVYRIGELKVATLWLPIVLAGEIIQVDLLNGETALIMPYGAYGMGEFDSSGWGLHYDDMRDELVTCGNLSEDDGVLGGTVRIFEPITHELIEQFTLPDGILCHALVTDSNGNIYVGDTNISGDIVKIDRETGNVFVWLDEPEFELDSPNLFNWLFGRIWLGAITALTWDGENNFYVSANDVLYRIPLSEGGTAGHPVAQTVVDAAGSDLSGRFYGLTTDANGVMYGTRYDFDAGESQVVELIIGEGERVNAMAVYTDGIAVTGIDYDAGILYGADGQLRPTSFGLDAEGSWLTTPYRIHTIMPPTPATEPTAVTFTSTFSNNSARLGVILLLVLSISVSMSMLVSVSVSMERDG